MRKLMFLVAMATCYAGYTQTSMLSEFKAMPAFPVGAKEAYKASAIEIVNGTASYVECSQAIAAYVDQLKNDIEPYSKIAEAKANKSIPVAKGAATDFAYLNSPETQAKLASMTPEQKLQFAAEVQAKMAQNKNIQSLNSANKPSPLAGISIKLSASGNALAAILSEYKRNPFPGYSKCAGICKRTDPACAKKVSSCESKISHDFYTTEIASYASFLKEVQIAYNAKKEVFETDLKEFDMLAAKYSIEDVAADYSAAFVPLAAIADKIKAYERAGSEIIISSKNNVYCKSDY